MRGSAKLEKSSRVQIMLSLLFRVISLTCDIFTHCFMPALFLFGSDSLSKFLSLTSYIQLNRPFIPSRRDGTHDLTARVQDQGL